MANEKDIHWESMDKKPKADGIYYTLSKEVDGVFYSMFRDGHWGGGYTTLEKALEKSRDIHDNVKRGWAYAPKVSPSKLFN